MKTKQITQVGYVINGTAILNLWGGGQGSIEMESYFLPLDKFTPKNLLRCVNDNGFGCESIESAEIDISIKYDNGCTEYETTIGAFHPIHQEYFLGWGELRDQGIKC